MKIKALATLCKKSKIIKLYESEGVQWLSNGIGIYPLHKMPHLNKQNIFAIFDIPDNKQRDYYFVNEELPKEMCFEDIADYENILIPEELSITKAGTTLQPIRTQQGLMFIDLKYLKPLEDIEETLELYERVTEGGKTYIAVKCGFMLMGIVGTFELINKNFVKQMEELTSLCKLAYANLADKESKEA